MSKELVITKVVKNIEEVQIMFDEFIKINKPFNKNKLKKALLFIHTDKIDRIKALFNKYIIDEFHKINLLINDINSGTVLTTRNRIIDFLDRFPIFISTLKKIEDEEIIKEKETIRKEAEALKLKNETELKRREALKRKEETERELKRIQEKQRQEEEKERQRREEEEKEVKIQRQEEEKTKHKEYEKNKIKIREEIQEKSQAYYNALTEFTRATTEQLKATIDHIEAYAEKENLYYVDAKEKSLTPEKSTTPKKSPTTQKIPSALSSPLSEDYIIAPEYPIEDAKKENDILTNELRELLKKVKKVEETGEEEFKQGTGQEEFKQGTGQEEFKQGTGEEKFNEEPEREEFNEEPEREEFKEQSERKKHSRSNPYSHKFDIGIKIKKEEQKAKIIEAKISNFTKENEKKIKKEEKKLENANIELEKANKELENANIELKEVKNNKDVGVYPKSVLIKKNMARRKTLVKLHQVRKLGRSIKIRGQLLVNVATDKQFTKTLHKSARKTRQSIRKVKNTFFRTQSMPSLLHTRHRVQMPQYHPGQPVPVTARSTKKSLKLNRPVLMEVVPQDNAPIFNSQPKQQSVPMDIEEEIPQGKLNDFNLNLNTPFLNAQTKSRLNPSLASQSVPMIIEPVLSRPDTRK